MKPPVEAPTSRHCHAADVEVKVIECAGELQAAAADVWQLREDLDSCIFRDATTRLVRPFCPSSITCPAMISA